MGQNPKWCSINLELGCVLKKHSTLRKLLPGISFSAVIYIHMYMVRLSEMKKLKKPCSTGWPTGRLQSWTCWRRLILKSNRKIKIRLGLFYLSYLFIFFFTFVKPVNYENLFDD